ncbi:MAG TPA: beta-ketoacyl reductase, partial [Candidatus Xenobia bacterium]
LDQGAEHVAVMTRTARPHLDPRVSVHAGDVGDAASVAAICQSVGPLSGVVHAAMQLDDVPTRKLTRERLEKVFHAKIHGAWNLHQATLDQPLEHFILYSSNATWFGSGGQGNYSAANAYLDALAHARRAQGRPALVVNWGPIGDVGYLARNPQVATWLASGGSRMLPSAQALEALRRLLLSDVTQAGVMDVDWDKMGQGQSRRSARFAPLLSQAADAAPVSDDVRKLLLAQLARVLGTSPEAIDPRRPVSEMGLDSLMSLQLRNWAKTSFNVTVTASALLAGPTVEELVGMLTVAPQAPEPVVDPLEHLDDAAVDELLSALLLEDGSVP